MIIKFYQFFLSPILGYNCRYYPSCSSYSYDAITNYGFFTGLKMTILRLLRCNPFAEGGFDPAINKESNK